MDLKICQKGHYESYVYGYHSIFIIVFSVYDTLFDQNTQVTVTKASLKISYMEPTEVK